MRLMSKLSCALAALAMFTSSSAVLAQDAPTPGEILGNCVDAMLQITERAASAQQQATASTVSTLNELAKNGAPDRRLVAAAHRGLHKVHGIADTARGALNTVTRRCLHALEAIDAPEAIKDAVRAARATAGDRLQHTTQRSRGIILDALRDLIGDEKEASTACEVARQFNE